MTRLLLLAVSATLLPAQEKPRVHTAPLTGQESDAELLALAARVVPHPRQLSYHAEEFIAFVHFGPNTFSGREWGTGKENPVLFNPPQVDTDQWCRAFKAAGMKKVILTVKHHDGYCLWQTRYNKTFSVHQSPWKDGKGDVLRLLADSCQKHGLRLGVYLSPADLYQIESPGGLYGNLSEYRDTAIPTDPARFHDDPAQPRKTDRGVFQVQADDYNRYFMNQLYELLTEYGPVHEVWFDGAHPKRKGGQKYLKEEWFAMIRALAPQAVIFGGPDVRWCGNEAGRTRKSEWNVLPVESLALSGEDRPLANIGDDASLLRRSYEAYGKKREARHLYYLVPEVDTSIRNGWFWRNDHEQRTRPPAELFDIYERSAGGNAVFLLNVPPNRQGRLADRDVAALQALGRRIRATYGKNLAQGHDRPALDDDDPRTFWQPPGGKTTGALEITLPAPREINRLALREAIGTVGQRVAAHEIHAEVNGSWRKISEATTIGHKRIHRFPVVLTQKLRVQITAARAAPALSELAAHLDPAVACQSQGQARMALH